MSRLLRTGVGIGLMLTTGACARYHPEPLDPVVAHAAWLDRDPLPGDDAPPRFDLTDGIDPIEAEAVALVWNPRLRATRLEAGIPAARAAEAGRWEDPELSVDAEYVLDEVAEPWVLGGRIGITIPLSGRPAVRERLAEDRLAAAQAAVLGAEWALRFHLRQAWSQWLGSDERVEALRARHDEVRDLRASVAAWQGAGQASLVDLATVADELASAEDALATAEAEREQQRLRILALIGLHPAHAWRLEANAPPLPRVAPVDLATLGAHLATHPRLRTAMAGYQVAERELQLEVRKQYPDLHIGFGGGVEEGESRLGLGLGLLPIPVWNRNRAGIAAAAAARRAEAGAVHREIEAVVAEIAAAQARLDHAEARLNRLRERLLPAAALRSAEARAQIGRGRIDAGALASALAAESRLQLERIDAVHDHRSALLALRAALGPEPLTAIADRTTAAEDRP